MKRYKVKTQMAAFPDGMRKKGDVIEATKANQRDIQRNLKQGRIVAIKVAIKASKDKK